MAVLLQVEKLSVGFRSVQPHTSVPDRFGSAGTPRMARVVEEVSFCLDRGQSLCLVGESGCGKSVTALSILGLLPGSSARLLGGRALFEGEDMLSPEKVEPTARRPYRNDFSGADDFPEPGAQGGRAGS